MTRFFLVILLIVISAGLRLYGIGDNPPGLTWDEVSIGYNAYSILKTARDEHNRLFPLDTFTAYGDYKPPAAVYLTIPFVAIFGLNEIAVRLPSALSGVVTVLLTFLLVRQMVKYLILTKRKPDWIDGFWFPFLTSCALAFSPWHINLSRAGWEANIALAFMTGGLLIAFFIPFSRRAWHFVWIPFVLSVYTFNSARFTAPLAATLIVLFFRRYLKLRDFIVGTTLGLILLIPITPHLLSPAARLRFKEVNIFTDQSVIVTANQRIGETHTWWAKIVYNRRVGYIRSYLGHFLDHFQPRFLFVSGDGNPKFSIQDVGQFYLIDAVFLFLGLLVLFRDTPSIAGFLLVWIILAIVPAATARETPHALRILDSLPAWQIFIAGGWLFFINRISGKQFVNGIRKIFSSATLLTVAGIYIFLFLYYQHNYNRHYPYEYSGEWQYGYKQALLYIKPMIGKYEHIYVTDVIGRPYMYTLFYMGTDPDDFRNTKKSYFDADGFYHVTSFGKYSFFTTPPKELPKNSLVIGQADAHFSGRKLQEIRLLNGQPILVVYET